MTPKKAKQVSKPRAKPAPSTQKPGKQPVKKQEDLYKNNPFIVPTFNRIYNNPKKYKIAADMLERYTGSEPGRFKKQIILTNFEYYIERFHALCG
ncbi:MAG: hypothetical protein EOP09_01980, partial [Proteobacteria bacterium]